MVPSSPNGPCSTGITTSTSPSACGTCPGALATTSESPWYAHGTTCASGFATESTLGSSPAVMASRPGSSGTSSQLPSVVMPMGMTSYLDRSIAASTLPAPRHEIACSGPLPPKTTATLILRSVPTKPPVGLRDPVLVIPLNTDY